MEILNRLKNLDAYPKINEDFYNRTLSGGLITIFSSIAMLLLFFSEFRLYLNAVTESKLTVDTSRGETLRINFDVTFPALACSLVSIDAMDISGEQHYDIRHDIIKKRIDQLGNVIDSRSDGIGAPKIERPLQRHGGRLDHNETYCGSCFGAEVSDSDCCNSCEEVREAYQKKGWAMTNPDMIDQTLNTIQSALHTQTLGFASHGNTNLRSWWDPFLSDRGDSQRNGLLICTTGTSLDLDSPACKREGFIQKIKEEDGEGCNIHGFVEVNKVAGNFHFTPGKFFHQASLSLFDILASFQTENFNISHKINKLSFGEEYPGFFNPLDGVQWTQQTSSGMYQYFIKVVPTIYTNIRGRKINSNQFSVTEHFRSAIGYPQPLPGVFFFYDFSPIKVAFSEEKVSLLHFLTNVCAIIGGIFTIAGIVDAFVYHGQRVIKNKMALGKYG